MHSPQGPQHPWLLLFAARAVDGVDTASGGRSGPVPAVGPGHVPGSESDAQHLQAPRRLEHSGQHEVDGADVDNSTDSSACFGEDYCVPQVGANSPVLDAWGHRLMYGVAYRNFGDHESLIANMTVSLASPFGSATGIRWYEVRNPNASPVLFQTGLYGPDGAAHTATYRWLGDGHRPTRQHRPRVLCHERQHAPGAALHGSRSERSSRGDEPG